MRLPFRRPGRPVADLTSDDVLRRVGATHDTHGRFTGRRGARPMCRPDDFPPYPARALPGKPDPTLTSPWVRRAHEGTLSVTPARGSLATPAIFEPVAIHAEDTCPDPSGCLDIHVRSAAE